MAINADSSMAWLGVVRIRQRIDGTITINWWIITIVRLLTVAPSQPHDRLADKLVAGRRLLHLHLDNVDAGRTVEAERRGVPES